MTFSQLAELVKHIEEEHNFFNKQSGQRIVKSINPHINLRGAGAVNSIEIRGYGWEKTISDSKSQGGQTSMFSKVMAFLDTPETEDQNV